VCQVVLRLGSTALVLQNPYDWAFFGVFTCKLCPSKFAKSGKFFEKCGSKVFIET